MVLHPALAKIANNFPITIWETHWDELDTLEPVARVLQYRPVDATYTGDMCPICLYKGKDCQSLALSSNEQDVRMGI